MIGHLSFYIEVPGPPKHGDPLQWVMQHRSWDWCPRPPTCEFVHVPTSRPHLRDSDSGVGLKSKSFINNWCSCWCWSIDCTLTDTVLRAPPISLNQKLTFQTSFWRNFLFPEKCLKHKFLLQNAIAANFTLCFYGYFYWGPTRCFKYRGAQMN